MAGLLEKDVRLIMQRKQMLLLFVVIAVVLGFSQDGTFILGYLSLRSNCYGKYHFLR